MNLFYKNYATAHKAIHIAKSLRIQQHKPKLVNEYVFANANEKETRAYNNS